MYAGRPFRVLIAEDEYFVSASIRDALETLGYIVVGEARDGQQAVALTCSLEPDVVVMDIKMTPLNGIEAARQIQERCPTPIVILSAFQDSELIAQANSVGVGAYLIKPPNMRELECTIAVAIARFDDMRQLRQVNAELREEIAVRKRVERQLNTALQEKEVLLKEVHHRVKNNLQIMASLLYLQAQQVENDNVRDVLQVGRDRIRSMAIVHEELYQAKDLANIEFAHYIRSLSQYLYHAYGINPETVVLRIEAQKTILTVETAIPCALVLNELLSNALRHAFPNGRPGEIGIEFYEEDQRKWLRFSDNGVGIPEPVNLAQPSSLGLSLVVDLVQKQLHGTLDIQRSPGAAFIISFP
jgi:two-component sensor histidine kinase